MSGISNMPQESTIPGGSGPREESLHPECGLRVACVSHMTVNDVTELVSVTSFGGVGGAAVDDWTVIPLNDDGRMDVPMTPAVFVITATPAGKSARFRFRGLDQFYAHQTEITPWFQSGPRANTLTPISKVFSIVTSIEFQSIAYDTASDLIGIGISNLWDPVNAADDTENLIGAISLQFRKNHGIGIPIRITPFGTDDPYPHPEILGDVMGHNPSQTLDQSGLPAIASIKPLPRTGAGAGFTVGVSEPGWQGDQHKLGFDSSDDWVTEKIPLVDGSGDFRMGGEVEGAASTPPRAADVLEFTFMVRTAAGTRRRANPKSSYEYAQN